MDPVSVIDLDLHQENKIRNLNDTYDFFMVSLLLISFLLTDYYKTCIFTLAIVSFLFRMEQF
jgi:hypothetical protein